MKPFRFKAWLVAGSFLLPASWNATAMAGPHVEVTIEVEDDQEVGLDFFHDELSAHGHWFESSAYGLVWAPHHMPEGWQPYTVGHWEYTDDYGWLWVSDLEWGWAAFHYGRWVYDQFNGWAWVPDTEWGPAWVAWREGEGHVGWAPLPPQVGWEAGVGLGAGGFDINLQIHPRHWSFVPERYILEPHLHRHRVAPIHKITLLRKTADRTRYVSVDGRVVNRGLSVSRIQEVVGRPVPRRTIRVSSGSQAQRRMHVEGSEITMYRPKVVRRTKVKNSSKTKVLTRKVSQPGHSGHKTIVRPAQRVSEQTRTTIRKTKSSEVTAKRRTGEHSAKSSSSTQTRKVVRPSSGSTSNKSGAPKVRKEKAGSQPTKNKKKP
jgi:hypothetical protein